MDTATACVDDASDLDQHQHLHKVVPAHTRPCCMDSTGISVVLSLHHGLCRAIDCAATPRKWLFDHVLVQLAGRVR